jgi:hypothetical protein
MDLGDLRLLVEELQANQREIRREVACLEGERLALIDAWKADMIAQGKSLREIDRAISHTLLFKAEPYKPFLHPDDR